MVWWQGKGGTCRPSHTALPVGTLFLGGLNLLVSKCINAGHVYRANTEYRLFVSELQV